MVGTIQLYYEDYYLLLEARDTIDFSQDCFRFPVTQSTSATPNLC
jgi:hypothetical protein